MHRISIIIRGAVQGVGFRPFIYRLAKELNLNGFVQNSQLGVIIEAEQYKGVLNNFILKIEKEKPLLAIIQSMEFSFLDVIGYNKFEIRDSQNDGNSTVLILPDIAVCEDCLNELFDPNDRRYLYPFINCTNCGPRFSIIESLPYDRPNTTMKIFNMCSECENEYNNPLNRRFHAQPIACKNCGPKIKLFSSEQLLISENQDALNDTVTKILNRNIIALKGIGGYQLICRADDEKIIKELRKRKNREEKPFALMFPNIALIKKVCEVSPFEERLLKSPESPIVILRRKPKFNSAIVNHLVAPSNPNLGIMLPYSPIHHILLNELKIPIIATSGNLSEEPMCITEEEAFERLKRIADYFLVNDRPIVRHVDDSIVRIVFDREMIIRRARGYAPLPFEFNFVQNGHSYLALGGHLKNSIAITSKKNVFVSQHIGDLSTNEAYNTFKKVINDFSNLYAPTNVKVAADLHPDYISTKYAINKYSNTRFIQHHQAHVASCYAENKLNGSILGVSWDGTGYGLDKTIWGGEFFKYDGYSFTHFAQLKKFPLPGGDLAIKEPKRSAIGLLFEIYGNNLFEKSKILNSLFSEQEKNIFLKMLNNKINSPLTSSIGRLFDAVSSISGIQHISNYEGQAAMMLEFSADTTVTDVYPFDIIHNEIFIIDYGEMIKSIINDINLKVSIDIISAKFHNTLNDTICKIAELSDEKKIILSGGVFQNIILLEGTIKKLIKKGLKPYWHQRIPTNDGGISLGQIAILTSKENIEPEN